MKRVFQIMIVACYLLIYAISGSAQFAVPIEKESMHRLKFENEFVRLFDVLVRSVKRRDSTSIAATGLASR